MSSGKYDLWDAFGHIQSHFVLAQMHMRAHSHTDEADHELNNRVNCCRDYTDQR